MSDILKKKTSKRIKELRTSHKYTMEKLADMIGVSKSTIAKWENGYVENMRQDKILKLSQIFNVPATYIMGYDEEKDSELSLVGEVHPYGSDDYVAVVAVADNTSGYKPHSFDNTDMP